MTSAVFGVALAIIGASLSEPHTSVTAFAEVVCILAAIYRKFQMSAFKYFMKTKRSFVHAMPRPLSCISEGLLTARVQRRREARGTKTTQVNAHMATVDHDRQG